MLVLALVFVLELVLVVLLVRVTWHLEGSAGGAIKPGASNPTGAFEALIAP
jgi:hypothetical protein